MKKLGSLTAEKPKERRNINKRDPLPLNLENEDPSAVGGVRAQRRGVFRAVCPDVSLKEVVSVLKRARSLLIVTHKDPDADGIGSMLALGKALLNAKKDVVLLTAEPLPSPLDLLKGADRIIQGFNTEKDLDGAVALDCGEKERLGGFHDYNELPKPVVNIDHHETNDFFGDLNLVDAASSSTGELIYKVIRGAGLPIDYDVAENIFAAIQADTGSFKYGNTTPASLKIAAEMMKYGVTPWELSRKLIDGYSLSRLELLEMALGTIEFHHAGEIAMMTLSSEMIETAQAGRLDSERFVDYPRFIFGVEIAAFIRQTGMNEYKFSLRSNSKINVAQLASRFGGGGHARAAGFECHGAIGSLKADFLKEAIRFLDGIPN